MRPAQLLLLACSTASWCCATTEREATYESGWAAEVHPIIGLSPMILEWAGPPPHFQAFSAEDDAWKGYRPDGAVLNIGGNGYKLSLDGGKPELVITPNQGPALRVRLRASPPVSGIVNHDISRLPVRIIESGNQFQHITLEPIPLVDAKQAPENREGRLEVRAWHDRIVIDFSVPVGELEDPRSWISASLPDLPFENLAGDRDTRLARLSLSLRDGNLYQDNANASASAEVASPGARTHFEATSAAWRIEFPPISWKASAEGDSYPFDELDTITRQPFSVTNPTDRELIVPLRFIHPQHPVTGFVPMILDANGRQTGWPVQVSKNWHTPQHSDYTAYSGEWINASAVLRLPPRAKAELTYAIVHARWNGLPAASVGQLSLVGWGGNGFWTQFALGSWGETICIQPARMLRRCYITDVRPLFAPMHASTTEFAWSNNLGGGDLAKIVSKDGIYQPWGGGRTEYVLPGPVLAQTRSTETLANGTARLITDTYLSQDDEVARPIIRARLEVLAPLQYKSLDLVHIATDYYNSNLSDLLTYGKGDSKLGRWKLAGDRIEAEAGTPSCTSVEKGAWMLLHGIMPHDKPDQGQGMRMITITDIQGRIGGKSVSSLRLHPNILTQPLKSVGFSLRPDFPTDELAAGDWIEVAFRFSVFPSVKQYKGKSTALRDILSDTSSDWSVAAWEARRSNSHSVILEDSGRAADVSPFRIGAALIGPGGFRVTGVGPVHVPVLVTGLSSAQAADFVESTPEGLKPLGERHPDEAEPQINLDPVTGTWTAVLKLRPEPGSGRVFKLLSK